MSSANIQRIQNPVSPIKSLQQDAIAPRQTQNKALGGTENRELANWYESSISYYNAVMNGQEPRPSEAEWMEFINQMNWAYQQLMSSPQSGGWDPMETADFGAAAGEPVAASDPFGAMRGTNGNLIHNEASAHFGFIGNDTRDVWSNDITIDIAPLSAKVQVTKVMDESTQPASEVLKVIVTDPATGTQAVYVIHDFEDAEITINAADTDTVSGIDGTDITVEQYEANATTEETQAQASIPGEAHPENENHWIYEGRIGQSIEFYPEGNGEAESVETHEVYGDTRILTRPSDQVSVTAGMPGDDDGYTVTVKHRDGSFDTYYIHKGFDINLNAMPEYITWGEGIEGEETGVPSDFSERFSLQGDGSSNRTETVDVPGDEPTEDNGDGRVWDGSSFDITARKDGKTSEIFARNDLTLRANSNQEYWTVAYIGGANPHYEIKVYNSPPPHAGNDAVETFNVDSMVNQIKFDIDPSHIDFLGDLGAEFSEGHIINQTYDPAGKLSILGDDESVQVANGEAAATENQISVADYPVGQVAPQITTGNSWNRGRILAEKIELGLATDDWSQALTYITDQGGDKANDSIRQFLSGLHRALGSDTEKLKEILRLIPQDVRSAMIARLYNEEGEQTGNDVWNTRDTRAIINASIVEESLANGNATDAAE